MFIVCISIFPFSVSAVDFTILHTNDFHGQLELSGSNPGMARTAKVINDVRSSVGASNVLLVDAGDGMQGSLLSNLLYGEPTIAVFNAMGYHVATFGNHEFDWGQTVLATRTSQAVYPYVSANIVENDTGNCATAGWNTPSFAQPYAIKTVGTLPNQVRVGFIGVTTMETPFITLAENTEGLCFKDPADSIIHYYDTVKAQSDVIVVLSHLGYTDGGYGYGYSVYGEQSLAQQLNAAGKAVPLIIGSHSHTDLASATTVGQTKVVQAHYNGRKVGRADISFDPATKATTVNWQRLVVSTSGDVDPTINALIQGYVAAPDYQNLINQEIGWTNVPIGRNYNGDSLMGSFINDAIYMDLNTDGIADNDVDIVFNNPGGLRADIVCGAYPCKLTFGAMFSVLPFGNQTVVGNMTGAQIMEVLNQSATLLKGALQPAGLRYSFFRYSDALPGPQPYAWGAFDVCVINRSTQDCEPLDLTRTYRVGTNEFLSPAGQDGFTGFKYMTNITYWGDMLDGVNRWVNASYAAANPYNNVLDGRITRDGTDTYGSGSIIPVTILHHNDSHGNLAKGAYVGYTQLATLIKQERAHNPTRTLLLSAGDQIQGDAMMYYFKSAPLGYAIDGTILAPPLDTHPMMAAMNSMGYDAMTLGNHDYNFGKDIFTHVLKQANFPVLQANVSDDGQYGLTQVPVQPYVEKNLTGIHVAILGIGNHRVPYYELPSNIVGLTFFDPLDKAQEFTTQLRSGNDIVVALSHIGFTQNPSSIEVDTHVDTAMAMYVSGLDAIVGGHSHTNPANGSGDYKYLPVIVGGPNNRPVVINHAYRHNNTLGEIILGVRPKAGGGFEVASNAGRYISVTADIPEDTTVKAIVDPYTTMLNTYNGRIVGQTTTPIDSLQAYTQETNGANLQADAAVWKLNQQGIAVDFHLSGAVTNRRIADGATPSSPVNLLVSDMFSFMPYENTLVVLSMNGPQIKEVLERAYRNFYYYKYVPGYGGYSYYTTCMLDINSGGHITYNDLNPYLPNGYNVFSLVVNGQEIDFNDASSFYNVSTVNYLAAGSCNFNDQGVSLWPLNQIMNDTLYTVRDATIDYIAAIGTVSPVIESRISFVSYDSPLGTIGTRITLTGPGFGNEKGKVLIGGIATKIISWADSTIICEIKKSLSLGQHEIIVMPKEPKGAASIPLPGSFIMMAPEIASVEPHSGSAPNEIIISGNYFGIKKGKVYLQNLVNGKRKSCKVSEWSMFDLANGGSRIRFTVPKTSSSLPPGTYSLVVDNKIAIVEALSNFVLN
jgi:2',3'-cyclic-nucleotide 2'-phosphodiesterase (5'-nucleotidase family)